MKNNVIPFCRHLVIAIIFVISPLSSWTQPRANVLVDQIDSLRNTYTVTYIAPPSSVYAEPVFQDTLFCAAVIGTLRGTVGIVTPMQRLNGDTYRSQLIVPDSAYTVWIEICIPTDRAPDGILSFYVKPDGGAMWSDPTNDETWVEIARQFDHSCPLGYG